MRMIWARRKASPQPRVDRLHFVVWDFLRMFLAIVICGLAVSLVAAGIALALAHDAYAASSPGGPPAGNQNAAINGMDADPVDPDELQSYPGMLLVGSDCGGEAVDAAERDWKVKVDGNNIDVRVMQTFVVPDGDASTATFNAQLPPGAGLLRLTVHTTGRAWQGKAFDAKSHARLNGVDFRNLSRKGFLIVQNDDGAISTDAIVNVAASEAIVVEYTYRLAAKETMETRNLVLTLGNDYRPDNSPASKKVPNAAVWVEWLGKKPARLVRIPSGATLETSGTRIDGVSWTSSQPDANSRFQLAWLM